MLALGVFVSASFSLRADADPSSAPAGFVVLKITESDDCADRVTFRVCASVAAKKELERIARESRARIEEWDARSKAYAKDASRLGRCASDPRPMAAVATVLKKGIASEEEAQRLGTEAQSQVDAPCAVIQIKSWRWANIPTTGMIGFVFPIPEEITFKRVPQNRIREVVEELYAEWIKDQDEIIAWAKADDRHLITPEASASQQLFQLHKPEIVVLKRNLSEVEAEKVLAAQLKEQKKGKN